MEKSFCEQRLQQAMLEQPPSPSPYPLKQETNPGRLATSTASYFFLNPSAEILRGQALIKLTRRKFFKKSFF